MLRHSVWPVKSSSPPSTIQHFYTKTRRVFLRYLKKKSRNHAVLSPLLTHLPRSTTTGCFLGADRELIMRAAMGKDRCELVRGVVPAGCGSPGFQPSGSDGVLIWNLFLRRNRNTKKNSSASVIENNVFDVVIIFQRTPLTLTTRQHRLGTLSA